MSSELTEPRRRQPAAVLSFCLALLPLATYARVAIEAQWPLPQCLLRKFTGIPCPVCGCTRSLAALAQWDIEQALRFNPLFLLTCFGLMLWLAIWAVGATAGRPVLDAIRARACRLPLWRIAIALVATNWLYLYLKLPK
jgi:uncharacterized protein DUF2752